MKNPLTRAQYILEQNGHQVNEGDSLSDPGLLMEVMEFREELEEITTERDLVPLKQRNDGRFIYKYKLLAILTLYLEKYLQVVDRLTEAFDKEDYQLAKNLAIELQYLASIKSAIHEWHQ